jgi:transcriptional regulator with XRE-family HTH domain
MEQLPLHAKLRKGRELAGMTQDEVADKLKVTRAWISQIETGRKRPSPTKLMQYANLFGFEHSELLASYVTSGMEAAANENELELLRAFRNKDMLTLMRVIERHIYPKK